MGQDWIIFVMSSNLPKYMREVIGFSVRDVGLYSSLPYVLMWIISLVSARICDYLIRHDYVSITQARKMFTVAGTSLHIYASNGSWHKIHFISFESTLCDREPIFLYTRMNEFTVVNNDEVFILIFDSTRRYSTGNLYNCRFICSM